MSPRAPPPLAATRSALDALSDACAAIAPRMTSLSGNDIERLYQRVAAVVDELKAEGALPERVLITLKRVVTRAGIPIGYRGPLLEHMTVWFVERYFPPTPPAKRSDGSRAPTASTRAS
jgi:hypothetical protein